MVLLEASAVLMQVWRVVLAQRTTVTRSVQTAPAHMAYDTDGDLWQDSG